eukprot:superscaffoldBa00000057_g940
MRMEDEIEDENSTQTERESDSVETEREDSSAPSGSRGARCKTQAESGDSLGIYLQWREAREEVREAERQQCQAWQELQTDEVYTFLSSLASSMRRLIPEKLFYVKIKMQQLVHDAALWGVFHQQFSQDPTYRDF